MPAGEGRAERLEGGRQRFVGRGQAGPQRVAPAGWYLQGLQDPEPRGNVGPAQVGVPGELRGWVGRGVLDQRYRLLASGEPLQRVHGQGAEVRRHLSEAPLVAAESPDEHDVVVDDELTELRRAVVPGVVEGAGVDHGADRARQALRPQWRRRGGGSRHWRRARIVLGGTFRYPVTFTHDTVGHIGRTWGVSWSEGPMCLAGRSTFRPMNPRRAGWLPGRGRLRSGPNFRSVPSLAVLCGELPAGGCREPIGGPSPAHMHGHADEGLGGVAAVALGTRGRRASGPAVGADRLGRPGPVHRGAGRGDGVPGGRRPVRGPDVREPARSLVGGENVF